MNPITPTPWSRLVAAARKAVDSRDVEVPYGFAIRVVSLAFSQERPALLSIFERLSLRVLGVAALLAVLALATHLTSFSSKPEEDMGANVTLSDPVTEVLVMTQA